MRKVTIIAEAGVNHNGDEDLAFQLVDAAVEAGADIVKFQTFKAESLVTKNASKAKYQQELTGKTESQFEMLKRLELSHEMHLKLMDYCKIKKIQFLSTAFDLDSLYFLVNHLGLKTLKIPSGDLTNGPLLLAHAKTHNDLIISTGMATLDEIEIALGVVAFGFLGLKNPSIASFSSAFSSVEGQEILKEKVTLLHCTSEYPAPLKDINLNAMISMVKKFGIKIGYSDHSEGITVPIAATALGATIIEKHFTLDKTLPGPDHKASLEPQELSRMVSEIRAVEKILGDGVKGPQPSELGNRDIARKSIVAMTDIAKGHIFTANNIAFKRPGTGKSPMEYWDLLGKKSHRRFKADDVLS